MYIQHGVNVCALYFVCLIPLIIILFLIKITILWRDLTVELLNILIIFCTRIVNIKLLLYPNSVLSENYKYRMSKYKISHLDWNRSLLDVLNNIEVPPLSVYELYVCNTVRELCQLRDNLYSCNIYTDTTDIKAMLNDVCTE